VVLHSGCHPKQLVALRCGKVYIESDIVHGTCATSQLAAVQQQVAFWEQSDAPDHLGDLGVADTGLA
jgi:hypothetical protein